MSWADQYVDGATPSATPAATPTATPAAGWADQYVDKPVTQSAQSAQSAQSDNPVTNVLQTASNYLKPTSDEDLADSGAGVGQMLLDYGGNFGKDFLSILGGLGTAAVAVPTGIGGNIYKSITGNDPQNQFVQASQQITNNALPALGQSLGSLGDWASKLVTPGQTGDAISQAANYAYEHPLGLLSSLSGATDAAGAVAKGVGKIVDGAVDNAALNAVKAGLTPEEAATASVGSSGASPLTALGNKLQAGAAYMNPLPSIAKPINPNAAEAGPGYFAKTAANVQGGLTNTDPATLLNRFANPDETAPIVSKDFNPYQVVQNANDAVNATLATKKAVYLQNEQQFLSAIPEDHQFNGLTDQSPQELYQPPALQAAKEALFDRGVDVTIPNAQDYADMQRLGQAAQDGSFGNGILHTADTPFGTAGTGNGYNRYDTTGYMADSNRFNQLSQQYGIKAQPNPGSGFGFVNRDQLGSAPLLAQKGAAMSEFAAKGAQPEFSFPGSFNDGEIKQITDSYNNVANNKDWTANGINELKKTLYYLQRPEDTLNRANGVVGKIAEAVKKPLTQFPEYNEMNSRYAEDSEMLGMMQGILKPSQDSRPDLQLGSLMRAVNSKNPIVQEVLQRIHDNSPAGSPDFRHQLTSYVLNNEYRTPSAGDASLIAATGGHAAPGILASILASNPQQAGNFMASLGRLNQLQRSPIISGYRNAVTNPTVSALIQAIGRQVGP